MKHELERQTGMSDPILGAVGLQQGTSTRPDLAPLARQEAMKTW